MKEKKLLFYCPVFYPENSGYSNAFQNLIYTVIDNLPVSITVITPYPLGGENEIKRSGLKIIRLKQKFKAKKIHYLLNQYLWAREILQIIESEKFDLFFIETFEHALVLSLISKKLYDRILVRIHGTNETEYTFFSMSPEHILRRLLIKKVLIRKIKWMLSTNSYHINFAKQYYFSNNQINIGKVNFFILPNTIFTDNIKITDFSIKKNRLRLVIVGRMDYLGNNQKGFTDFVYALKLLNTEILEKYEIIVIGKGKMRSYLMSLCKDIENIKFIESLNHNEMISLLIESDVVVLPSRYEGLSMFALEALATGNICIFSHVGGLIDLVDGNGLFFEPQNIESLSMALTKIALKPKEELESMKKRSIEIFKERFAPEVIGNKFSIIYNIVTGETL